jgi:hypothetical protein
MCLPVKHSSAEEYGIEGLRLVVALLTLNAFYDVGWR